MHGMRIKTNDLKHITTILIIVYWLTPFNLFSQNVNNKTFEKALAGKSSYQSDLIDYYYNTTKNYIEAINWCNILIKNPTAKESEMEYAYRILGLCAYGGKGMDTSIDNAISYWKHGVGYKGGSCALYLGRVYAANIKDSIEAIKWYVQAADLKNKTAAYFLAQLYENGFVAKPDGVKSYFPGVSKNIMLASKYYDIYINDMGYNWSGVPTNSKLLYKLAQWYYAGEGNMEKNYVKAFKFLNLSIECNENSKDKYKLSITEEGNALWCISVCYRFGRGVEKDELMARRYVKRAAEKGNINAISLLDE